MNKQVDSNVIAAAFDSVYKFNDISKQFDFSNKQDAIAGIDLQLSLIFEELTETIDALDTGLSESPNADKREAAQELLDGAADLFVVTMGLLQKLKVAGFNVEEALLRVTENNLSKFPVAINAQDWNWYESQGWTPVHNEEYNCFVLKDKNGKTRKPVNYAPVDLSGTFPVDFFTENVNV